MPNFEVLTIQKKYYEPIASTSPNQSFRQLESV